MGLQTLEALMLRSTISCRLEWKIEGVVGRAIIHGANITEHSSGQWQRSEGGWGDAELDSSTERRA